MERGGDAGRDVAGDRGGLSRITTAVVEAGRQGRGLGEPRTGRAEVWAGRGLGGNGARGRIRTTDTAIFSRMLYQLSYPGRAFADGAGPFTLLEARG